MEQWTVDLPFKLVVSDSGLCPSCRDWCVGVGQWNEVAGLRDVVNDGKYGGVAQWIVEISDEVCGYVQPVLLWHRERL